MKRIFYFILALAVFACSVPFGVSAESGSPVVIAFGDSIAAAGKWQSYLKSSCGIEIINAGVGGDSTRTAKARFERDVLSKDPDVVFIGFGTNDAAIDMAKYTPLEDYKENLRYFIDSCHAAGAKVIVIVPPPIDDEPYLTRHDPEPFEPYGGPNGLLSLYAQAARDVAEEKSVTVADVNRDFLALEDYSSYLSDGIHPTDAGYKLYSQTAGAAYARLSLGNMNGDEAIDMYDCLMLKSAIMGQYAPDAEEFRRGDVDCDGELTMYDYLAVKSHVFGRYVIR